MQRVNGGKCGCGKRGPAPWRSGKGGGKPPRRSSCGGPQRTSRQSPRQGLPRAPPPFARDQGGISARPRGGDGKGLNNSNRWPGGNPCGKNGRRGSSTKSRSPPARVHLPSISKATLDLIDHVCQQLLQDDLSVAEKHDLVQKILSSEFKKALDACPEGTEEHEQLRSALEPAFEQFSDKQRQQLLKELAHYGFVQEEGGGIRNRAAPRVDGNGGGPDGKRFGVQTKRLALSIQLLKQELGGGEKENGEDILAEFARGAAKVTAKAKPRKFGSDRKFDKKNFWGKGGGESSGKGRTGANAILVDWKPPTPEVDPDAEPSEPMKTPSPVRGPAGRGMHNTAPAWMTVAEKPLGDSPVPGGAGRGRISPARVKDDNPSIPDEQPDGNYTSWREEDKDPHFLSEKNDRRRGPRVEATGCHGSWGGRRSESKGESKGNDGQHKWREERKSGYVVSMNSKGVTWFGFIKSEDVTEGDVHFHQNNAPVGIQVKDNVTFVLHWNPDGKPQAREVKIVCDGRQHKDAGEGGVKRRWSDARSTPGDHKHGRDGAETQGGLPQEVSVTRVRI